MARHRTPQSVALIDALIELGDALGYHVDPEYPVTESGGAVDVAWFRHKADNAPLFIFEVETAVSNSAAANPLKVFGQKSNVLPKPLFFFHVFLPQPKKSERIKFLEEQYGSQNYRAYVAAAVGTTQLVIDVLHQHRRVATSIRLLPLVGALRHEGWVVDVHEILEAVEGQGFDACYVPDYARLAYEISMRRHLLRQISSRQPFPAPFSDDECWYRTWLGDDYAVFLHLGILAHEVPTAATEAHARLREWQEPRDGMPMCQIGPYLGLSYDYDQFILGVAAPLWALLAALFPPGDGRRYCSQELRALVEGLDRVDPSVSTFSALWLLWVAAAADAEDDYVAAADFIRKRGGLNAKMYAAPPSLLALDGDGTGDDEWWDLAGVSPIDPPELRAFRRDYIAPVAEHHVAPDVVRVALDVLLDESAFYEWSSRITAGLAGASATASP